MKRICLMLFYSRSMWKALLTPREVRAPALIVLILDTLHRYLFKEWSWRLIQPGIEKLNIYFPYGEIYKYNSLDIPLRDALVKPLE